jgi:hypothetical protein
LGSPGSAYRRKMWCALGCRGAGVDKGDVLVDACEPAVAVGVRRLIEEQLALCAEGLFCIGAIPRSPEPKREWKDRPETSGQGVQLLA